jgi:hypothetical protein
VSLRALQTGSAVLGVAALVAIGQTPPAIAVHDGSTTMASSHPAIPTEWSNAGPLAIPTIGVFPPGTEDWFDPGAEPTYPAQSPLWTAPTFSSTAEAPAPRADEPVAPVPTTPADPSPAGATPLQTTEAPQRTGTTPTEASPSPTEASGTSTTPGSTTPQTTTPRTTTPTTTTPETTSPTTTTPETTSPTTTTPAPTEQPAPPTPPTNARGNVVLAFGEQLTVFDGVTGAAAFAIAIGGVAPDPVCTAPESAPAVNGHLVAVRVRVVTGADLSAVGDAPAIRATDFRYLADGSGTPVEAATASAASCLAAGESFPAGPLGPGREVTGVVVLDVPAITGTLVYAPGFLSLGAEWAY